MTVKEMLAMLETPDKVDMSWDGNLVNFNFNNEIEVEVWGDYVIRKINATGENKFELILASRPVKKGAAA